MINFRKFLILTEAKTKEEILTNYISKLEELELLVKIKNGRLFAYTKRDRFDVMKQIANAFRAEGARIVKPTDDKVIRISSIGYVTLNNGIDIVVKPLGRDVKQAEKKATNKLDALIKKYTKEEGKPITIKIGKYVIENVSMASSEHIKGDPKADITLMDEDENEIGFISHKKAGGASAFQQYSGLSQASGAMIYNSTLVKEFVKDIYNYLNKNNKTNIATSGMSFKREVPNDVKGENIVGKAVYGFDWKLGSENFGRNFVHCIGQGEPKLKKKGKVYELDFSDDMHTADNINWAFSGEYKAFLAATYRVGRKIESEGIVVENLRGGIYPEGFIKNRKSIKL